MIHERFPLNFQWPTLDPFLFCVHHQDFYPKGTPKFGPDPSLLAGRDLGQDFQVKDGFRMYHGREVPGFPVHPHRGFETITIAKRGLIDHADSLGAAGRYGDGDVQWMTAGAGVQHSEMFPLIHQDRDNTVELFQLWLNLPSRLKMTKPFFKMLWAHQIPRFNLEKIGASVILIAGEFQGIKPPAPPPDSWASQKDSDVGIMLLSLSSGGKIILPKVNDGVLRALYVYSGDGLKVAGESVPSRQGVTIGEPKELNLQAANSPVEILLLQARPIGEPIVQHGPYVMNSQAEIRQTIADYQSTRFGGWPWPRHDMIHGSNLQKFAKYPDGHIERPEDAP